MSPGASFVCPWSLVGGEARSGTAAVSRHLLDEEAETEDGMVSMLQSRGHEGRNILSDKPLRV